MFTWGDQTAPQAFMDAVKGLSSLPYFRLFLSDLRQLNDGGEKDAAYMREQVGAICFIVWMGRWVMLHPVGILSELYFHVCAWSVYVKQVFSQNTHVPASDR